MSPPLLTAAPNRGEARALQMIYGCKAIQTRRVLRPLLDADELRRISGLADGVTSNPLLAEHLLGREQSEQCGSNRPNPAGALLTSSWGSRRRR
jgi:hypothetical protein